MNIFYFLGSLILGIGLGAFYFLTLWRSTNALVSAGSVGVGYLITRILSIFFIFGLLASLLSSGIDPSYVLASMIGFFLARVAATRWAQLPPSARQRVEEAPHAP